jgi:hypothetical protein
MPLPLDRKLALIPIDDDPVTAEGAIDIDAGINSLNHQGGVSMEGPRHPILPTRTFKRRKSR